MAKDGDQKREEGAGPRGGLSLRTSTGLEINARAFSGSVAVCIDLGTYVLSPDDADNLAAALNGLAVAARIG